jgi:hypothetical protein
MGPNAWKQVVIAVSEKRQKIVEMMMQSRQSSKLIENQILKDIAQIQADKIDDCDN